MIKLQAIGNLGKDAQVNQVNGKNVINFTVAHTERYRDSAGGQKEKTTWVECAYWTDRIGVVPYLKRGAQVYIEGTPEVRQFTRTDGTAGATLSLRVLSLQLVGTKADDGTSHAPAAGGDAAAGQSASISSHAVSDSEMADDLPF